MIEDFLYVGMNYIGDTEFIFPPRTQWGPLDKKMTQ